MARVAIIDYGGGNLHSVCAGLRRVMGPQDTLDVTDNPQALREASHILLPGVGSFGQCMTALRACEGMIAALEQRVHQDRIPFLGICVGMQMLFERGYEHGEHTGLGWLRGNVTAIPRLDPTMRIPHMGWNALHIIRDHPILAGITDGEDAYFVHSYHASNTSPDDILATTDYGHPLTALVAHGSIIGAQFHPEKSHTTGKQLLENFLKME